VATFGFEIPLVASPAGYGRSAGPCSRRRRQLAFEDRSSLRVAGAGGWPPAIVVDQERTLAGLGLAPNKSRSCRERRNSTRFIVVEMVHPLHCDLSLSLA
jgi:hypothetical protein